MNRVFSRSAHLAMLVALVTGTVACSDSNSDPAGPAQTESAVLLSVTPAGGSVGVDPRTPVIVKFSQTMAFGMEAYCALHLGDLDGPEVPGNWTWSNDRHTLTFIPDGPLQAGTEHTLHVGGGMLDAFGHYVDMERHGLAFGGMWADSTMFSQSGMMGGRYMGRGWRNQNGSFGMFFTFVTAQ